MERSDADLVRRARKGSDAAFAALVDRHSHGLRVFLARVCANAHDADDAAQEAFLAAWTRLRMLKDPARFRPWLYGIAWRKAKGGARSAARSRQRSEAWQQDQPGGHTPDHEAGLALRQGLTQLNDGEQAGLALCLGAGLTHVEAAKALEMPLGTLKSHVTRGRARLAAILGVADDD